MLSVELLVAGAIVVLVALLARGSRRRSEPQGSVTEAQARENAAPLTTAILTSDRPKGTGL
jgi:hypothetical protein